MSVWASDFDLSLGQVSCAEKSNEITAIPELLRLVDIQGTIITIDAMGLPPSVTVSPVMTPCRLAGTGNCHPPGD